jgi:hypothetical protein
MKPAWTSFAQLVATLRRRWARGDYLTAYATGAAFAPITLPVKGPTASEFLDYFDEAVRWAERFGAESRTPAGQARLQVEHRTVKRPGLGANDIPARVRVESFDQLVALLGVRNEVDALDAVLKLTDQDVPELRPWVAAHPHDALAHRAVWGELLATIRWIVSCDPSLVYLRQVDVRGVDTKFIEHHQRLLDRLLRTVLPPERVDLAASGFAQRYGFRRKPVYVRFRLLAPLAPFPGGVTELRLRADELAGLDLDVGSVFVVENEISYLAFPEVPDAMVIFGEGSASAALEVIPWLAERPLVYWGDIDTHGFAILDRLRARFDSVDSILMDHATLLAHPDQWVREDSPVSGPLPHLTPAERSLYADLVEARFSPSVRLEQERVRFGLVMEAIRPWTGVAMAPVASERREDRPARIPRCPGQNGSELVDAGQSDWSSDLG